MSATTGAAILGIIALLFTVASIVLALALCKLLGKWFVWFLDLLYLGSFDSLVALGVCIKNAGYCTFKIKLMTLKFAGNICCARRFVSLSNVILAFRSSRRSKSEWVDSRIYEDLDTPKLTKKTKCKASKTSLLSYDENVFESTGTVVR